MMDAVFLKILNMSLTASWLILAVTALRAILRKAPKALRVLLWALVGLRLILPVSIESPTSLIPDSEPISPDIMYVDSAEINYNLPEPDSPLSPSLENTLPEKPQTEEPAYITETVIRISAAIWLTGIAGLLLYAGISYFRITKKVGARLPIGRNVYLCDHIDSPFILGIFRPRIYIPSGMDAARRNHVIAHETAHLKRKDHWWKPLGFLILCIHWFNPLIWVSYLLLCRDIELACDEKAIKDMDPRQKTEYTETLLSCSISRKSIAACPLAFGEVAVKDRVKAVLNYKKPAFWLIVIAIASCIAVAICFLTNPANGTSISGLKGQSGIFRNVSGASVITEHFGYTSEEYPEKSSLLRILKAIRLEKTPLDSSRNELRDRQNAIQIVYEKTETELCFNEDCTEVWINDGVKPSFTYQVLNPEEILLLFDRTYKTGNRKLYKNVTLDELIDRQLKLNLIGSGAGAEYEYSGIAPPRFRESYRILGIEQRDPYVFTILVLYQSSYVVYETEDALPTYLYGPSSRPATMTYNILERSDGILYYHPSEFWFPSGNESDDIKELNQKYSRSSFGELWEETLSETEGVEENGDSLSDPESPVCGTEPGPNPNEMMERIQQETVRRNQTDDPNVVYRTAKLFGSYGSYHATPVSINAIGCAYGMVMYKEYGESVHKATGEKTWKELRSVAYPIVALFPRYSDLKYEKMEYHVLSDSSDPALDGIKNFFPAENYDSPWTNEDEYLKNLERLCIIDMIQHTGYDPTPVIDELFHLVPKSSATHTSADFSEEYPEECATLISLASYSRDYVYKKFLQEELTDLEAKRMWYVLANVLNKDAWLQTATNEETRVENPITERDLSPIATDGKQAFDRLVQFVRDVEAKFERDHTLGNSDMEQLRQLIEN